MQEPPNSLDLNATIHNATAQFLLKRKTLCVLCVSVVIKKYLNNEKMVLSLL